MTDLDDLEEQLKQHIDRRLEPGQRGKLLKQAGKQFTLWFEFGKDWVRLRQVKRSKAAQQGPITPVETAAPTPKASVIEPVGSLDADPKELTRPGPDWQPDGTGRYALGSARLVVLEADDPGNRWRLVSRADRDLSEWLPLAEALVQVDRWLDAATEKYRDQLELAHLQLEVMQSHADEATLSKQRARIESLEKWLERFEEAASRQPSGE